PSPISFPPRRSSDLLARPQHPHRSLHVPRDACREHDAVDFEPPAEPATDEVTVQADLLGLEAEGGELGHGAIAGLRPRPDLAYVLAPVEGAIHRLERGMREERLVI